MGQEFKVSASPEVLQALAARLSTGETISTVVYGSVTSRGTLKPRDLQFARHQYVPGATPVAVVGKVQKLDRSTATFSIGNLTVDYSSLLGIGDPAIADGRIVRVIGIRASTSGELAATSILSR
jgi:hypothetical protein